MQTETLPELKSIPPSAKVKVSSRRFVVAWISDDERIIYQRVYCTKTGQEALIQMLKEEVSAELFCIKDFYYMDEVISTAFDLGYHVSVIPV